MTERQDAGSVRIFVDVTGWFDLSVEEIWPNGDAPEQVTAEAVRDAMEAYGSKGIVLSDWEMITALEVHVGVRGGDTVEAWASYRKAISEEGM